jgi:hypothetical protein
MGQTIKTRVVPTIDSQNVLMEELPPLHRKIIGDNQVLTRESILAKLEHEDIRKDLVNLPNIH